MFMSLWVCLQFKSYFVQRDSDSKLIFTVDMNSLEKTAPQLTIQHFL